MLAPTMFHKDTCSKYFDSRDYSQRGSCTAKKIISNSLNYLHHSKYKRSTGLSARWWSRTRANASRRTYLIYNTYCLLNCIVTNLNKGVKKSHFEVKIPLCEATMGLLKIINLIEIINWNLMMSNPWYTNSFFIISPDLWSIPMIFIDHIN